MKYWRISFKFWLRFFKLIEMAGTLFDSKIIKHEIREKYKMIIALYDQEVQAVNDIFEIKLKEFKEVGLKVRIVCYT